MTSDDRTGHDDDVAGHDRGATGDPLRDFLLGVAAQIDQLAAMFGGTGQRAAATGISVDTATLTDLSGEITTLVTEIGDLLARLIAALIAVLEAMANVLRSSPPSTPDGTPHYQPIPVRIDIADPPSGSRRNQFEGEN